MVDYAGRQPIIFRAPSSTLDAKAQADLAATYAAQAAISAQASAAAAAGRIYPDYATGNAATTTGQYFFVASGGSYYLHVHGTPTAVVRLPTIDLATGALEVDSSGPDPAGTFNQTYGAAGDVSTAIRVTLNAGAGGAYLYGYGAEAGFNHNCLFKNGTGWVATGSGPSRYEQKDGDHVFYSNSGTPGDGFTPVERLRLLEAGTLRPGTDNFQSLGTGSIRWSVVYAGTGTINTSDRNAKTNIGAIPEAWLDAWADVEWSRFKFVDGTRWHVGLVAQQVHEAFAAHDIDAFDIGLCCFDEWEAEAEVRDDDGVLIRAAVEADSRWGLRYSECEAMEAAYQRRRIAQLEAQVAAL